MVCSCYGIEFNSNVMASPMASCLSYTGTTFSRRAISRLLMRSTKPFTGVTRSEINWPYSSTVWTQFVLVPVSEKVTYSVPMQDTCCGSIFVHCAANNCDLCKDILRVVDTSHRMTVKRSGRNVQLVACASLAKQRELLRLCTWECCRDTVDFISLASRN